MAAQVLITLSLCTFGQVAKLIKQLVRIGQENEKLVAQMDEERALADDRLAKMREQVSCVFVNVCHCIRYYPWVVFS